MVTRKSKEFHKIKNEIKEANVEFLDLELIFIDNLYSLHQDCGNF